MQLETTLRFNLTSEWPSSRKHDKCCQGYKEREPLHIIDGSVKWSSQHQCENSLTD